MAGSLWEKGNVEIGSLLKGTKSLKGLWEAFQELTGRLERKPRIGLALGSGSAWGVAHIGVLSVLKELGIEISFLSGSSAGSFVGALCAGGVCGEDLEECGRKYRWRDAGRISVLPKMGLASNERMADYLHKQIGNPNFEDLKVPFFVTATNLNTGKLVIFDKGPVIPAVQASCAIPGIFAPVRIGGQLYCDGGVLNILPCNILRKAGADFVIGVQLGKHPRTNKLESVFEVITRALEIALYGENPIRIEPADLLIEPRVNELNEFGFDQNDILIERGKQAAYEQLKDWEHILAATPGPPPEPIAEKTSEPA
jgi:NTE family protein